MLYFFFFSFSTDHYNRPNVIYNFLNLSMVMCSFRKRGRFIFFKNKSPISFVFGTRTGIEIFVLLELLSSKRKDINERKNVQKGSISLLSNGTSLFFSSLITSTFQSTFYKRHSGSQLRAITLFVSFAFVSISSQHFLVGRKYEIYFVKYLYVRPSRVSSGFYI